MQYANENLYQFIHEEVQKAANSVAVRFENLVRGSIAAF